jgi:hypothetical protein
MEKNHSCRQRIFSPKAMVRVKTGSIKIDRDMRVGERRDVMHEFDD